MQNLPISALFCFIVLYSALFCFIVVSFFISVAYLRQFFPALFLFSVFPALFPFSSFFFYRQIVFAALLCPLRRDLIPTNTPQKIPFPPRKSHYSDFSKPQYLHISKKMRIFAPQSSHWGPRRTQTKRVRWGERRHRLPVYLAERYKPLHTDCRTRLHQISGSPLIHQPSHPLTHFKGSARDRIQSGSRPERRYPRPC